eukprot:COSAG06_NODE_12674_length_1344_cov_0.963052_1_plen_78_part_10
MSELIESLQSVLDQPSLRLLNEKLAAMDQQGDARGFLDGITTETDGCVNSVAVSFFSEDVTAKPPALMECVQNFSNST